MNFNQSLEFLHAVGNTKGAKCGLENIKAIIKYLDIALDFPMIHVGGTNGKGSVCYKLSHLLSVEGYKTGLFVSPHIFSICERVQINNSNILHEDFAQKFTLVKQAYDQLSLPYSFFEMLTALAFLYFSEQTVDIAIIEVGLGGRLDATNIITPLLSIITSVQKDHQHILGETLDKIAYEKAGIIKPQVPVILAPSAARLPAMQKAFEQQSPIILVPDCKRVDTLHQLICKEALKLISKQFPVSCSTIEHNITQNPLCRYQEFIIDGVKIIFDVAHNEAAIENLLSKLSANDSKRFIIGVSGIAKDKKIIEHLVQSGTVHLIDCNHSRLISKKTILSQIKHPSIVSLEKGDDQREIKLAFDLAKKNNEILVITGSIYIFSYVVDSLGIKMSGHMTLKN